MRVVILKIGYYKWNTCSIRVDSRFVKNDSNIMIKYLCFCAHQTRKIRKLDCKLVFKPKHVKPEQGLSHQVVNLVSIKQRWGIFLVLHAA